jgi:hypothetical protein
MIRLVLALWLLACPALAATPTDATVAFYHGAPDRAGNYVVPGLTYQSAGAVRRDTGFDGRVEGHVYAQPLYWRPPGAARGLIIVATESDTVFALDAASGRLAWQAVLGQPVPQGALPCGNIDPLGITGTPVIDAPRAAVYLDAMVDDRGTARHLVFGLRLSDGAVLAGFPVDVARGLAALGTRFSPREQNQRGALALLEGRILVPFGGHWGDCGEYHGMVAAVGQDSPRVTAAWVTRGLKGGIWAPAGLSEADGAAYFATGNTEGARSWADGEGVFRVGPDLVHSTDLPHFFAPADWKQLDDEDLDLGGVTPLPLKMPNEVATLMLALGKDGNAYLLKLANLGGIGGALAIRRAARGRIFTAAASYPGASAAMVVYQAAAAACPDGRFIGGIAALAVMASGERIQSAWCARMEGRGAPIVTTTDGTADPIVWAVGAEGDGRLHGFRGDTGQELYAGGGSGDSMTGLRHFVTILTAAGRFYVAGDGRIFAFDLPH